MSTTNKHQNGSLDHAFGLNTPSSSLKHNHMNFNFDDNFTELNHNAIIPNGINNNNNNISSKKATSANGTLNNDGQETITIIGDSKITKTINNNTLNEKKYLMNNYDSISYTSTSKQNHQVVSNSTKSTEFTNSLRDDLKLNKETNHYENGFDYEEDDNLRLNIETMRKVFNVFDSDQDGSITIEDVEVVMNSLQYLKNEIEMPSVDQIRVAFDKFDSNKNGSIEFDEFLNILKSAASQSSFDNSSDDLQTLPPQSQSPPITTSSASTSSTTSSSTSSSAQASSKSSIKYNSNSNHTTNSSKLNESTKTTTFNNNNSINYNTFKTRSSIIERENSTELLKKNMKLIFEQFDKDNDGKITKHELNFVMCNLFPDEVITEQDIKIMLQTADLDNNGFIDFNEFANMFMLYSQNANGLNESSEQTYNSSSTASVKSPVINNYNTNHSTPKRNTANNLDLHDNISTSSKSNRLAKSPDLTKSNKSLSRTISRSSSKEGKRSRTHSQTTNSGAQSPSNFRKVVQLFTSSQMMDLKAAFTMFDKNGDQKISESELLQVMKYLGIKASESDVKAMIQVVDKNRNGYVDYDEFIQMMTQTQLKPLTAEEELRKTFNIFDIDGNGYISADEIKKTMAHLGENLTDEEVNDMIKAADKNGDGRIDLSEFSGLLSGSSGGLKQSTK